MSNVSSHLVKDKQGFWITDSTTGQYTYPIEQRMKMIYKLNSNMMNNLKPLLSLPILAILFISFSCEEEVIAEAETPVAVET